MCGAGIGGAGGGGWGGGLKRGLCCHSAKQLMWAGGKGCVQV